MCGASILSGTTCCLGCGELLGAADRDSLSQPRKYWANWQTRLRATAVYLIIVGLLSGLIGFGAGAGILFSREIWSSSELKIIVVSVFLIHGMSGLTMLVAGVGVLFRWDGSLAAGFWGNSIAVITSIPLLNLVSAVAAIPCWIKVRSVRREALRISQSNIDPFMGKRQLDLLLNAQPEYAEVIERCQFDE